MPLKSGCPLNHNQGTEPPAKAYSRLMDSAYRHRVNCARTILREQQDFFHRHWSQVSSDWKDDDSRVTFADFALTERIFRELREHFPKDGLGSEESAYDDEPSDWTGRQFSWVLDPIDGTNNFAVGLTSCAISLALLHRGQPVYGFIYDGSLRALWEGGLGQGVRLGTRTRSVARPAWGKETILACQFPVPPDWVTRLSPWFASERVRNVGSLALHLAYTAGGIFDGCIAFKAGIWDVAAGIAMAREQGLQIGYLGLSPFPLGASSSFQRTISVAVGSSDFRERLTALFSEVNWE